MKGGSLKKNLNKVVNSKVVLYVLFALTIFNLFGYLARSNLAAIVLFLLVGYGTTHFTKNMVYVLLTAILSTNFLVQRGVLRGLGFVEGFKEGNKHDHNHNDEDDEDTKKSDDTSLSDMIANIKPKPNSDDTKPDTLTTMKKRSGYANMKLNPAELQLNQQNLNDAVDNMGPILEKADKMLEKLEGSRLGNMIFGGQKKDE
jgi:hypothetical protein